MEKLSMQPQKTARGRRGDCYGQEASQLHVRGIRRHWKITVRLTLGYFEAAQRARMGQTS